MKKLLIILIGLFCLNSIAFAKTVYVTDHMKYTLRSSENNRSKILKMLSSGTVLTVLSENNNYTQVRTKSGIEGYILTRYLLNKPISRWYLNKANKKLDQLQLSYNTIEEELNQLKNNNTETISSIDSVTQERDKLSQAFNELSQTAANAVELKLQRDQLQERVIGVEKELQQLKHKNQTLEGNANQTWFMIGGGLSLFSVILGFILRRTRSRQTNHWDNF